MRKEVHARDIESRAWLVDDDHWEIVIRLLDTKGYDTTVGLDKPLQAGDALHEMRILLRVGLDRVIRDIEVAMPNTPFDVCPGVMQHFETLKGESMARGWNSLLSERFSGAGGCRHLVDMLRTAGTVLFQAISCQYDFKPEDLPYWSNSCFAFRKDGIVIQEIERRLKEEQPQTNGSSRKAG